MKRFEFSSKHNAPLPFSGKVFYDIYKNAEFLRNSKNVETILSKGYELRNKLKNLKPGERMELHGMPLERNTPLFVLRTGPNLNVDNFEFTANRLSGLVAAYAFDNRHRFPILESSEAHGLGLTWNHEDATRCRLFLASVTGSEHFHEQFKWYPLLCALRKLQLKKITSDLVLKIANIKNPEGVTMGTEFQRNFTLVSVAWTYFPGASVKELKKQIQLVPPELRNLFSI